MAQGATRGLTPIQIIMAYAPKVGLDPAAVISYALTQGGTNWGAVGDHGTSFGPFQAHIGGAAGNRSATDASSWANSPGGLQQMMDRMASGWTGPRSGPDAAAFIVGPHFGRGADPASDEAKARAFYGRAQGLIGGRGAPVASAMTGQQTAGQQWSGVIGVPDKLIGTPYAGTHTIGNWESDNAVDLAAPVGTPVYAAAPGTIGSQFGSLGSSNSRFAGLRLHLDTPGNEFYYAHLSKFAPGISPGTKVTRGQLLGYSGAANGVGHLHFSSESGDPRKFIGPGGVPTGPSAGAAGPGMAGGASGFTPTIAAPTGRRQLPVAVQQALAVLRS